MSDSQPTPSPSAPPTSPGSQTRTVAPVESTAAIGAYVGAAGLVLPFVGFVAIALGVVGLQRLKEHPDRRGHGRAIAAIVLGVTGLVITAVLIFVLLSGYWMIGAAFRGAEGQRVLDVYRSMDEMATLHGAYPEHVALILLDDVVALSPRALGTIEDRSVVIGDYDLNDFDGSLAAIERLETVLEAEDLEAPRYRVGAWWFMRLDAPTRDPGVVLAYRFFRGGKQAAVLDDSGVVTVVERDDWDTIWKNDAMARSDQGLPELDATPTFGEPIPTQK